MRHVRLIPPEVVLLARQAREDLPFTTSQANPYSRIESLPHTLRGRSDVLGAFASKAKGRRSCRCCGYPMDEGDRIILLGYRWHPAQTGASPVFIHYEDCEWGLAHDVEDAPVHVRSSVSVAAKVGLARHRASQKRETKREREEREANEARNGPVVTRVATPEELARYKK